MANRLSRSVASAPAWGAWFGTSVPPLASVPTRVHVEGEYEGAALLAVHVASQHEA